MSTLETAEHPEGLRRIVIDPLSRVEGHGKVTLLMDDQHQVLQARLHIVEFRGFERFIQGRPYWELPVLVQRLCGICPVSHHLAAAKAVDQLVGVDTLTPTAEKLRRLLHLGQILQSHALHFFHLSSPDLLFGFGSDLQRRNIVGVLEAYPKIAMQGVTLRKYGQEVIRVITGKRVHGTGALPGGMNKSLTIEDIRYLREGIQEAVRFAQGAVELSKTLFQTHREQHKSFALIQSNFMSLIRDDGALDLYHGGLRVKDAQGGMLLDHVDYRTYTDLIREEVRPWTYMKFPYLIALGKEAGWYRVGPLARINNASFIDTPLAEAARKEFMLEGAGGPVQSTLAFHWARMIEALHAAEGIERDLQDGDLMGPDLLVQGEKRFEGIGVIEAPRGTLFHHYVINEDDLVVKANLIVSTTSNNQAMNESIRQVAATYLHGQEPHEGLLNHLEVAIRAYDPCLSCATHALGKMPLELEILNEEGALINRFKRSA
jgi:NAD-reducing hydrogenase large subunit